MCSFGLLTRLVDAHFCSWSHLRCVSKGICVPWSLAQAILVPVKSRPQVWWASHIWKHVRLVDFVEHWKGSELSSMVDGRKVLILLGHIHRSAGSGVFWATAPDLPRAPEVRMAWVLNKFPQMNRPHPESFVFVVRRVDCMCSLARLLQFRYVSF